MEYVIDKKEYIKFESDIVVSGCVKGLAIPKIYETNENIYMLYEKHEILSQRDILPNAIDEIKENVKKYMLNPDRVVFHPNRISRVGRVYKFHYLPSRRPMLYDSEDLRRYLAFAPQNANASGGENNNTSEGLIYFKNSGKSERLILKNTFIGCTPKCTVNIDFDGLVKISNNGNLTVLSGSVNVNGKVVQKNTELLRGDTIMFGGIEAVYW